MSHHPYIPPRKLAEGLHCVDASTGRWPIGRRMTVVVLPSGRLALHSPIRMDEAGMEALERLGQVAALVIPNAYHWIDVPWYAKRYRGAAVLAPRGALPRLKGRVGMQDGNTVGTLEDDWSAELSAGLERLPLAGSRMYEFAFFHPSSRTLILTDLVFNLGTDFRGAVRLFLRLNRIHGRFGPSRLMRWVFLKDKGALLASLREMERWDFDRVVMSHGDLLESGGKDKMRQAFAGWGL